MPIITTRTLRYLPLCMAAAFATSVQANNHSFDARSHAMGGVGVSSADYLTAPFHNPALTARFKESDGVAVLFPAFGVHANDPTDTIENVEDFSDVYDDFKNISMPTEADAQVVIDQLQLIQGNYAQLQVGTQLAIAIPNKFVSVNLFAQAYADALVFADIADSDLDPSNIINQDLNSQALTMGVVVTEIGVSLAKSHQFATGELYYGVSPKYQQVNTINYITDIDNFEFDDWDDDRYQNDQGNMNLDVGVAYQHNAGFGFGFVGKNLIENSYDTELINGVQGQYEISPTYTVSANYQNRFITAAIDVQLNESEGYSNIDGTLNQFDSSNDNRQLAAIGLEFTPASWAKLRAGYQTDLTDNIDNSVTAGLGLSIAGVFNIDISANYSDENNMGAALQTSFTF
ncbi:conjugal transfer protein TraF [Shewanella sp. 6_MG-2023]|uniref:conjugal transfer protein TraF n=1 Tax=Shewanella sp. 6_MG-2023 TaxID=3062660 RepID=UPI0026E2FD93|nr:conjugal transfer protein TraF [Shewanella sp. 6_MG-2023]MDO6620980.1 conjugal transfer protein TraF [Shewanella sp. 6_MG-2023]